MALLLGAAACSEMVIQQPDPVTGKIREPSSAAVAGPKAAQPLTSDTRVVLISIDGLRPDFYLSPDFDTPTLHWLKDHGAYASSMVPIYPTVTYPNHTALVSGVTSAKSGIFANTIFSFTDGLLKDWYWNYGLIRVPTLWSASASAGLATAALGWPVTVGAPITYNVPEIFNPADTGPSSWELTRRNSDRGLIDQIAAASPVKEFHAFDDHDVFFTAGAVSILKTQKPALLAVHFANVDHVQHETGRDSKETHAAIALLDRQLKQVVDAIDFTRTTLFVVGDHGFADYRATLNFNALFAQKGWLVPSANGPITDWKVLAQSTGGVAAIYLRDEKIEPQLRQALRDYSAGRYTVVNRAALDELHAYPEAFCAIDPRDGFSTGSAVTGPFEVKQKKTAGNHGYLPSRPGLWSGLIAVGPQIAAHHRLGQIKITDVAPTIAPLLGVSLPGADGDDLELGPRPSASTTP